MRLAKVTQAIVISIMMAFFALHLSNVKGRVSQLEEEIININELLVKIDKKNKNAER